MDYWTHSMSWGGLLLIAWLAYVAFRPTRDYYVLQRHYFHRIYEPPKPLARGKLFAAHYDGFDDYLPAKAAFDLNEGSYLRVLDDGGQEAEHKLFAVPARSRARAIARLRTGKAYDKRLVSETPYSEILKRRAYWAKELKELRELEQEEAAAEAAASSLPDGQKP